MKRVRRVLLAAASIPVLSAAGTVLLLGSPASAHGDGHQVLIKEYMYMPAQLKIEQGETVIWTNEDSVAHDVTVTAGPASFQSPMLARGKSWSHTFSTPGRYSYLCSVHPDMKATIVVAAAAVVSRPATTTASTPAVARAVRSAGPAHREVARPGQAGAPAGRATPAARTTTSAPALVSAPQASATLQPLILVVGAAVAVVLFCLLLMASRPVLVEEITPQRLEPKHLEEA